MTVADGWSDRTWLSERTGHLTGPEGVASAPEGVLFVHNLAFLFVVFPSLGHELQAGKIIVAGVNKEVAVGGDVEQPRPVLAGDIGLSSTASARRTL